MNDSSGARSRARRRDNESMRLSLVRRLPEHRSPAPSSLPGRRDSLARRDIWCRPLPQSRVPSAISSALKPLQLQTPTVSSPLLPPLAFLPLSLSISASLPLALLSFPRRSRVSLSLAVLSLLLFPLRSVHSVRQLGLSRRRHVLRPRFTPTVHLFQETGHSLFSVVPALLSFGLSDTVPIYIRPALS